VVECNLAKVEVASSNLVSRSKKSGRPVRPSSFSPPKSPKGNLHPLKGQATPQKAFTPSWLMYACGPTRSRKIRIVSREAEKQSPLTCSESVAKKGSTHRSSLHPPQMCADVPGSNLNQL